MKSASARAQRVATALGADRTETLAGGQPSLSPATLLALASAVTPSYRTSHDLSPDEAAALRESVSKMRAQRSREQEQR